MALEECGTAVLQDGMTVVAVAWLNQTSSAPPRSGRCLKIVPLFSLMTTVLRCPLGAACIAAEQDLTIRADSHALRAGAVVERNREDVLTFMVLGSITATAPGAGIIAGAVDLGNV